MLGEQGSWVQRHPGLAGVLASGHAEPAEGGPASARGEGSPPSPISPPAEVVSLDGGGPGGGGPWGGPQSWADSARGLGAIQDPGPGRLSGVSRWKEALLCALKEIICI